MKKTYRIPKHDPEFEVDVVDDAAPPINTKITFAGIEVERIEIETTEGAPLADIERLEADLKYAREGLGGLRKQKDFWEKSAHDRTEERNEHARNAVALGKNNATMLKEIARLNKQIKRLTEQKGRKKR